MHGAQQSSGQRLRVESVTLTLHAACPAQSQASSLARPYADLVFIQNGMLQPWLDEKGLGDNTQVRLCVWKHQHA